MINGWLIYRKKDVLENQSYIDWFIEEAKQQQINLTLIYRESLTIGIENNEYVILINGGKVPLPLFAVVRTIEPFLQVQLEQCHIHTFNNSSVAKICNDKILTHLEVSKLNIPIVDTYFFKKDLLNITPPLPFPFVVKEAQGRSGKQVYFIQSINDWTHCLNRLNHDDIVIQRANVALGKDVRVFVVGKKIVAAVLRHNEHDFRANFKLGGKAIPYDLSKSEKMMIQNIVNHFNFGLVGIDFLIGENGGLLFNEIEDVVGSRILSEATRINLLQKYVTHIKRQLHHTEKYFFVK